MPDWLPAFDDALVQRYRVCILCAQPADRQELRSHDDFAMTMSLCAACVQADATEARREAVVEQHALKQPPRQRAP